MMARRSNAVRPLTIISHQHQTGGINIQPPRRMQFPRYRFIKKIEHRWVIRVVRGANIALRLIEHEVTWTVLLRQRVAIVSDIMLNAALRTISPSTVTRLPRISRPAIARLTPSCCAINLSSRMCVILPVKTEVGH